MSVTQFGPPGWEVRETRDTETRRRRRTGEGETRRQRERGEKGNWRGRSLDVREIWGGREWDDKDKVEERERTEKDIAKDDKEIRRGRNGNARKTWREGESNEKEKWRDLIGDEERKDSNENKNMKEDDDDDDDDADDDDDDDADDELAPLTPGVGEEKRSRVGRLDWCHCQNCAKMWMEEGCRCCHEDEGVWSRILEDESTSSGTSAYSCVVAHPFFTSVCLNPYALQALHNRDAHLFGYEEKLPLHEKYRITAYRAFVDFYRGQLEYEVECHHLPSCAASTIRAHFQDHAFLVRVPGYAPL